MLTKRDKRGWKYVIGALITSILVVLTGMLALLVVINLSPSTGARGADLLRNLLGPKPIASLEALVFTIQDAVHRVMFSVEQNTPAAPWESFTATVSGELEPEPTYSPVIIFPIKTGLPTVNPIKTIEPVAVNLPGASPPAMKPTRTPFQPAWQPTDLPPFGDTLFEGTWTPYILDESNHALAYRAFLQPDAERPYVFAAIVAFDLARVRLHFQVGLLEPESPVSVPRSGQIPEVDMKPGTLLAAFNGGFKTVNGHFGVFVDGVELLPPVDGMGTLVLYKDGSIRVGEWGSDITLSQDMVAYRQNCPLIVHDGEVNPLVFNNSVNDWGGTFSGNIVTFRSGIGLSQDGRTLYYFAGNTLSMPALAAAMQATGAYQAMQLDINSYYVLFTRFLFQHDQWTADPLLPDQMVDNVGRYLAPSPHDFFYVTAIRP